MPNNRLYADIADALNGRAPQQNRLLEPELRSYDEPWYRRFPNALTDLIYGDNANAQQAEWMRTLFGPANPINIPGQVAEGVDMARTGYQIGSPALMGAGAFAAAAPFLPGPKIGARAAAGKALESVISSQRYLDEGIVGAKRRAADYDITVSPSFNVDGREYQALLDGHHSLAAALRDGVAPNIRVADPQQHDAVSLLDRGQIDDFLRATHMGDDYHFVTTGKDVWSILGALGLGGYGAYGQSDTVTP